LSANLTRKELLKQDKFTAEATNTWDWISEHRKEATRYGGIAVAVILIVAGAMYYRSSQASAREQVLGEALAIKNAPVGAPNPGGPSYATQQAKDEAQKKAFTKLASDYSGSEKANIAKYYLGTQALDAGNVDEARKQYQDVADHASPNYASLAKLALAQLDFAQNRNSEAENLLKDLMDHPTDLVSKAQATYTYAKIISGTKPAEARQLLSQLAKQPGDVGQLAQTAQSDLPQQ
jgi:predicted negative regulator of RcsB-dependent stress response